VHIVKLLVEIKDIAAYIFYYHNQKR